MGVVFYHLAGNLRPELEQLLPDLLTTFFSYGYLGVPVFFVISGFVICNSTITSKVTGQYVGNFILRRSIRLDLTYWATIVFAIILLTVKNKFLNTNESLPALSDLFLTMFYLQDLVGIDPISVVYWTLCLEVQFYLFYIYILWLTQKITPVNSSVVSLSIFIALGLYSIPLDLKIIHLNINGLFVSNWHYFTMGVLACHTVKGQNYATVILMIWLFIEIIFQTIVFKEYAIAGLSYTAFIYIMWKVGILDTLFTGRILTYLGTISYTLYLLHPNVGWKSISLGKHLLGENLLPWQAGLLLLIGIAVSIIFAHIFHILFERPTQKIAARIKTEPLLYVLKDTFMDCKVIT